MQNSSKPEILITRTLRVINDFTFHTLHMFNAYGYACAFALFPKQRSKHLGKLPQILRNSRLSALRDLIGEDFSQEIQVSNWLLGKASYLKEIMLLASLYLLFAFWKFCTSHSENIPFFSIFKIFIKQVLRSVTKIHSQHSLPHRTSKVFYNQVFICMAMYNDLQMLTKQFWVKMYHIPFNINAALRCFVHFLEFFKTYISPHPM